MQERIILPLRAQNYLPLVPTMNAVFLIAKFTIPDGGQVPRCGTEREEQQSSPVMRPVGAKDLVRANTINELRYDQKVHRNNHRVACLFTRAGARQRSAEDAGRSRW